MCVLECNVSAKLCSRNETLDGELMNKANGFPTLFGLTLYLFCEGITPGGPRLLVNMYKLASVVLKNRQKEKKDETTVAEDALPS